MNENPAHTADQHPDEPGEAEELSGRVLRAFRRCLHLNRQLTVKIFAERGVHPGQAFCLRLIVDSDGISQRDLAATMHLSRPRITAMLQALERGGSVRREADPGDQRVTRVFVTDHGRRLDRELRSLWSSYVEETMGAMSPADRLELERLLDALSENILEALKEGNRR